MARLVNFDRIFKIIFVGEQEDLIERLEPAANNSAYILLSIRWLLGNLFA